jgi:hypothetical protein
MTNVCEVAVPSTVEAAAWRAVKPSAIVSAAVPLTALDVTVGVP